MKYYFKDKLDLKGENYCVDIAHKTNTKLNGL